MSTKFDRAVEIVLRHEGGYVDHPSDPGGATKYGISLRFARDRGTMLDMDGDGDVDKDDIRLLTREKAKMVYEEVFWRAVRGEELPSGVDLAVFDFGVNSGYNRAITFLQRVLGIQVDGVFGPATMAAVQAANPTQLIQALCDARMEFLRGLNTWESFGRGWTNRVEDVRKHALNLVGEPMTTLTEAVQTDTAKAAGGVAAVGIIVTVLSNAAPVVESLGKVSPTVAIALILASLGGFIFWRTRRA